MEGPTWNDLTTNLKGEKEGGGEIITYELTSSSIQHKTWPLIGLLPIHLKRPRLD